MSDSTNGKGFDLDTAPDLAAIEDEGIVVALRDAHDEPMTYTDGGTVKPVTITVLGTYSKTYLDITAAQRRRMGKRLGRGNDLMEVAEDNATEAVVACVRAWDGFFANGKPFPCTKPNVTTLLRSTRAQHIRRQIEQAMGDHERFFTTPSPT